MLTSNNDEDIKEEAIPFLTYDIEKKSNYFVIIINLLKIKSYYY